MNEVAIVQYVTDTFDDIQVETSEGNHFFFYGPERKLPFATIVTKDAYDNASNLNRPAVFRLNIGISKTTYHSLFGPPPSPPAADGVVATGHDFTVLDQLMPHPVYAQASWVCVLNPGAATFQTVQPLLTEAYELAISREAKRTTRG